MVRFVCEGTAACYVVKRVGNGVARVCLCAVLILGKVVFYPFRHVSTHVMCANFVRSELSYRVRSTVAVLVEAGYLVKVLRAAKLAAICL